MKRTMIVSTVLLALSSAAWAEKTPTNSEASPFSLARESAVDQLESTSDFRATVRAMAGPTFNGVTEEDVGDVESFGKNKIYLGVNQTQPVYIDANCSGYAPEQICYELDPVTRFASVDEFNLGSITLPKNSTNSLLCFTFTQFATWIWGNTSGSAVTGDMSLRATVQIESDFLNGLVDVNGNPFNGQLWPQPLPIVVATHQDTLPDGAFQIERERVTRSCTGGLVSQRSLIGLGLTETQASDFFKKEDITITFGTQGNAAHTDTAIFFTGIRIYGDD